MQDHSKTEMSEKITKPNHQVRKIKETEHII
jgi:hypothetical protein